MPNCGGKVLMLRTFLAHILGMDTLARGLRNVAKLVEDGSLDELVRKHYQSFGSEIGALIEAGKGEFETLEKKVLEWYHTIASSGVITSIKNFSCHHELETARINGLLGNIDANTGELETARINGLLEKKVLEWGEPTVPPGKQVMSHRLRVTSF